MTASELYIPRYAPTDLFSDETLSTKEEQIFLRDVDFDPTRERIQFLTEFQSMDPKRDLAELYEIYTNLQKNRPDDRVLLADTLALVCRTFSLLGEEEKAARAAESLCNLVFDKFSSMEPSWLNLPLRCGEALLMCGMVEAAETVFTRIAKEADKNQSNFEFGSNTLLLHIESVLTTRKQEASLVQIYSLQRVASLCEPTFHTQLLGINLLNNEAYLKLLLNEFEEVEGCLAGIHEKLFKLKEFITDNPIDADEDILKLNRSEEFAHRVGSLFCIMAGEWDKLSAQIKMNIDFLSHDREEKKFSELASVTYVGLAIFDKLSDIPDDEIQKLLETGRKDCRKREGAYPIKDTGFSISGLIDQIYGYAKSVHASELYRTMKALKALYDVNLVPWREAYATLGTSDEEIVRALSDELCDSLGLKKIPKGELPTLNVLDDEDAPTLSGNENLAFCEMRDSLYGRFSLPAILTSPKASKESFLSQVSLFVIYHHLHEKFGTEAVKEDAFERQAAIARALVYVSLSGAVTEISPPIVRNKIQKIPFQDPALGISLDDDSWVPLAHYKCPFSVHECNWPKNLLEDLREKGFSAVMAHIESELFELKSSLERISNTRHSKEILFNPDINRIVGVIRDRISHWIGYSVGEACAERILADSSLMSRFTQIALNPSLSLEDPMDALVRFATERNN